MYIDSLFKTITKDSGLICVTATDTAVLFGVKSTVCQRKYLSKPLHCEFGKEVGARILLGFLSRIAHVNNRGIRPVLTFYSRHFVRIFLITYDGKKKVNKSINDNGYIIYCKNCGYRSTASLNIFRSPQSCPLCTESTHLDFAGPLWLKQLHSSTFVKSALKINEEWNLNGKQKIKKILSFISDEVNLPFGYYDVHRWCKRLHLKRVPKMEDIIKDLKNRGFEASRTHFNFTSIKTNTDIPTLKKSLQRLGEDR